MERSLSADGMAVVPSRAAHTQLADAVAEALRGAAAQEHKQQQLARPAWLGALAPPQAASQMHSIYSIYYY